MGGQGQPGSLTGPSLTTRVRAVLDRHLAPGDTVVLAVSGGPDSVAMLHLVAGARPDLDLVVGHVRHGLRDDAPDAAAARTNARALSARYTETAADMTPGRGPEDTARQARYNALATVAGQHDARAVLVGHTMDDQAETVLLRISRGTGVAGLAAMAESSSRGDLTVLRPLLGERRSDVRAAAADHPHVIDPTNVDPDQRRARARSEALPALRRLHPAEADVVPLLARLADHARDAVGPTAGSRARPAATVQRFGMAVCLTVCLTVGCDATSAATGSVATRPAATGPAATGPAATGPAVTGTAGLTDIDMSRAAACLGQTWRGPLGTRLAAQVRDLAPSHKITLPGGWLLQRIAGPVTERRYVLSRAATPRLPPVTLSLDTPTPVPGHGDYVLHATNSPPLSRPAHAVVLGLPSTGPTTVTIRGRGSDGDRVARRWLQRCPAPLRPHVPLVFDYDGTLLMVGDTIVSGPTQQTTSVRLSRLDGQFGLPFGYQPG